MDSCVCAIIVCMHATVAPTQALARDLADLLGFVHRHASGNWLQVVSDLDLTLTQLKTLHVLDEHEDLSIKELAAALGLSLPAVSRGAESLAQRGLVERRESTEDRRSRRVRMTAAGRHAYGEVAEARIAGLTAFLDSMSDDERRTLSESLAPVMERVRR